MPIFNKKKSATSPPFHSSNGNTLFSGGNCRSDGGYLPDCKGTNPGLSVMSPDSRVLSRKKLKTHLEQVGCYEPCELEEFYPE